jgi:hypothetical protein
MTEEFTGDIARSPRYAASLLAIGIAPAPGKFQIRAGEVPEDRRILWRFDRASNCGRYLASECIGILQRSIHAEDPGHPAAILRDWWAQWDKRRDDIDLAQRLRAIPGKLETRGPDAAAALLELGHEIHAAQPFRRDDTGVIWAFNDTQKAREDLAKYKDVNWIEREPDNPRSYMGAAALTWRALMVELRTSNAMLIMRKGRSNIGVSSDSSLGLQARAAELLETGRIRK